MINIWRKFLTTSRSLIIHNYSNYSDIRLENLHNQINLLQYSNNPQGDFHIKKNQFLHERNKLFKRKSKGLIFLKNQSLGDELRNVANLKRKQQCTQRLINLIHQNLSFDNIIEFQNLIKSNKNIDTDNNFHNKNLIRSMKSFFLRNIGDSQKAQHLTNLFAECDIKRIHQLELRNDINFLPNLLDEELQINKFNEFIIHTIPKSESLVKQIQTYKIQKKFVKETIQFNQKPQKDLLTKLSKYNQKKKTKNNQQPKANLQEFKKTKITSKKQQPIQQNLKNYLQEIPTVQMNNQVIIFNKISNQIQNQDYAKNWVYIFNLPYIVDEIIQKNFLETIQQQFGKIKQYKMFSYKNMIQISQSQFSFHIPDDFTSGNNFQSKIKKQLIENINAKKKKENTKIEKILKKIKSEKELNLNKSYALLNFQQENSKNKVLSHDLRIFGMHFMKQHTIKFEEAAQKKTIIINNIPWGTKVGDLQSWINLQLEESDHGNLSVGSNDKNKIITKNYVLITFKSFWQTLKAIQILSQKTFYNQPLKIQHSYGNLRIFSNHFRECINDDSYNDLKLRLSMIRQEKIDNIKLSI